MFKKRVVSAMLAGSMLAGILSGCGKTGTVQNGDQSVAAPADTSSGDTSAKGDVTSSGEPTEISIFLEYHTPSPPSPDNSAQKRIEEKTNTKLDFMWQAPSKWTEKLNIFLASGDIPDLTKINNPTNPSYRQMASKDAFWDVGPYIKDYPNLMSYPEEIWEAVQYDGKQYMIPSVRPLEGSSFLAIRKDWLDRLGLDMPETTEDLYQALKAFKENDMNGDGKDNTIPFAGRGWKPILNTFTLANDGGIKQWRAQDGQLVDMVYSAEMVMAIEYLKKLYDEGLMIPEFASMSSSEQEELAKGNNVGMNGDTVEGIFRSTEMCRTQDPNADFCPLTYLEGPLGKYAPRNSGVSGGYVIPKTVSEEKMKAILNFMDFGASEEGAELACWGIEGEHFTKDESGFRTQTEKGQKENVSQSSYGKVMARYDPYLWAIRVGMDVETFERNKEIIDARASISSPNDLYGLVSDTWTKYGGEYEKEREDIIVQVIMGAPMSLWTDYVEDLKNDEIYQQITRELNDAYLARENAKQ